jgi:cobalamin biosynthesis protein CobT
VFDDFLKKLDLSEPLSDENEPDSPSDKDDDDKNDDKGQRSEPGNLPLPL